MAEIAATRDHRARRDARRRPRVARPPWRTASERATSSVRPLPSRPPPRGRPRRPPSSPQLLRFATAGSVDDGKSTLIGRLLYDAKSLHADALEAVDQERARRWTSRCSPTACAPSASRASRSTSPTATSPRRGGASSSPTPRATPSTRATWSPAPRRPTWRSCSSTPARACSRRAAATPRSPALLGIPRIVLAVNKMDLVDYDEDVFRRICGEFRAWAGAPGRRGARLHPDLRAQGRQRRRALGEPRLVRRADAAAVPRGGAGRGRPRRRAAAAARPVGRARPGDRAPRLRGPARGRHRAGRRRGRRAAGRARRTRVSAIDAPVGPGRGRAARRCRSPCGSRTSSTSRAGR